MITVAMSENMKKFSYCQLNNYEFSMALLNNYFQMLHNPFVCKDYFQDMFWAENTGNDADIWGLKWKKGFVDLSQEFFMIALNGGEVELKDRVPYLQEFLNYFDRAQGFPLTELLETTDPKVIVMRFSRLWTTNGPLLSSFMTAMRVAGGYKGGDPLDYLKYAYSEVKKKSCELPLYSRVDAHRLVDSGKRLAAILAGKVVDHSWDKIKNSAQAHNTGICGFKEFPEVEFSLE